MKGKWRRGTREVTLALRKYLTAEGERRVAVDPEGRESRTTFALVRALGDYSLLSASIETGRTHQIRVQLAHLGFPILGDDKYGDFELNRALARDGPEAHVPACRRISRSTHPLTGAAGRCSRRRCRPNWRGTSAQLESRSTHAPAI